MKEKQHREESKGKEKERDSIEGLTAKKQDFAEWYPQLVLKAGLADYSAVKGCMIINPLGYSIWENIQQYFNPIIRKHRVENVYFPLFIPESLFKKEAEHAAGFKPEVAWVQGSEEGERLAIRPTSETVMYDSYSKWIRSWRDLPLRCNQWCNVVRWETKSTRLFLRTREFLWQEGHCVYATKEECDQETQKYLNEYQKMCEEILAIPVLAGRKTDSEKFAGALYTLSIEGIMPDGRVLQLGTSHNLGQGFAKAFDISFLGKDGKKEIPWQNSWGFSTRLIGALTMVHGDDKGLILPPKIARYKVVIIPIIFKDREKEVLKKARDLEKQLSSFDALLDDREEYTAGWKFNEHELRGVPIRIEIGPRDVEAGQVVLVRRDTGAKEIVQEKELQKRVEKVLAEIQKNLLAKAREFLDNRIVKVKNFNELEKAIKEEKLALGDWCGSASCESKVKEKTGAKSVNMPLKQQPGKECAVCGKKASAQIYFGKSY